MLYQYQIKYIQLGVTGQILIKEILNLRLETLLKVWHLVLRTINKFTPRRIYMWGLSSSVYKRIYSCQNNWCDIGIVLRKISERYWMPFNTGLLKLCLHYIWALRTSQKLETSKINDAKSNSFLLKSEKSEPKLLLKLPIVRRIWAIELILTKWYSKWSFC